MKLATGLALLGLAAAQPSLADPVRDGALARQGERLFPLLTALEPAALPSDVSAMLAARRQRILACGETARCVMGAALWTDAERDLLAGAVPSRRATAQQLPDDGARAEVLREIDGLNGVIRVYAMGGTPRYPKIDGPNPDESVLEAEQRVTQSVAFGAASRGDPVTVLDPSVGLSLALLEVAGRDDAAAWEPLDADVRNGPAMALAKTLDWSRWPYAAIIVPGEGPDDLATPLSPLGKVRVRLAAQQYSQGAAPFIIVSGGAVHPRSTRFAEAWEMRRALIERFGIPANHVLIDPYARHTTTNLRNVARLLITLRAPMGREALIVTSEEQSRYIESPGFAARNQQELGYQPGTIGKRLSPTALPFRPAVQSQRRDPGDPLDP